MNNIKDIIIPDGWIKTTLGSQCSITTGKKDANEGNVDGKYPFFTCSRSHIYSELYSFNTEAILIAGNGDVGNLHYYNGKFEAYQRTYVLDTFKCNIFYVYQYLDLGLVQSLMREKIGTSIPYIKLNHLSDFDILLPKAIKEQEKIVEILTIVDETIEKTDCLIGKYKKIKAGLMEDLFTKGIDVATGKPHTKFKDSELGRIPQSWEVERLGNQGIFLKGGGFAKKDLEKKGEPCITYGEIYTKYDYVIKKFHSFLPQNIAKQCVKVNNGDILFAGSGETVEDIGKNVTYIGNDDFYAGGDVVIFRGNKNNNIFLSYLLCDERTLKQKRRLGQGSSVIHIYGKHLESIVYPKPKIEEQEIIADKLLKLDSKIEKEEEYKEKLVKMKKGLMNDLLTGKVRVRF